MQKNQKTDLIRIVLYSLSSLLVGTAVGGTLLMRIMQQPPADAAVNSALMLEAAVITDTDETAETTETTVTTEMTTSESTTTTTTTTAPPDSASIQEILRPAADLMRESFYYTDSDTYETHSEVFGARVPFTTDSVVLTYDGEICVGVPAADIQFRVDAEEQRIFVTLPQPELISHKLDESSVRIYDVKNSIFRSSSLVDYLEFLRKKKDAVCRRIRAQRGCDRTVLEQADKLIRSLLAAAEETRKYTVIVNYPDGSGISAGF